MPWWLLKLYLVHKKQGRELTKGLEVCSLCLDLANYIIINISLNYSSLLTN